MRIFIKEVMVTMLVLFAFVAIYPVNLCAGDNLQSASTHNLSVSIDPLTFASILLNSGFEDGEFGIDWSNVWFAGEVNYQTERHTELGFGLFLSNHNVAITAKHRSFYNEEQLRGFFWGFYSLVEWRRMYWWETDDIWPRIGWDFPAGDNDKIYHSLGATVGADIGFRYRKDYWGITAYLGLGIPLYFRFGDLPENRNARFELMNIGLRAIHLGLRVDLFPLFYDINEAEIGNTPTKNNMLLSREVKMKKIPDFKYHPNPIETFCPSCISNGKAAEKFEGEFQASASIDGFSPKPDVPNSMYIKEEAILEVATRPRLFRLAAESLVKPL